MDLYLIRHGEAGTHNPQGDDSQRPLTDEGVARMKRQAATLIHWGVKVDVLLSSPFTRARQTADIVGKALSVAVINEDVLQCGFGIDALPALLKKYESAKHLMLAGHEPDLSTVLSGIVGGGSFRMEKGSLARIRIKTITPPTGTALWFLTPELMGAEKP